MSAKKI